MYIQLLISISLTWIKVVIIQLAEVRAHISAAKELNRDIIPIHHYTIIDEVNNTRWCIFACRRQYMNLDHRNAFHFLSNMYNDKGWQVSEAMHVALDVYRCWLKHYCMYELWEFIEKIQLLRKYSCWENTVAEKTQLLRKYSCWENTVVEKIQLLRSCSLCNGKFDIISTHTYQCKFSSFQFPFHHLQLLPRCGGCMFLVISCHTSQSQKNLNTNNWLFGTYTVCWLHAGICSLYTY